MKAQSTHLMIVDDEVDVAILFQTFFESEGYRASIAHDVSSALKLDEADPADAVITDFAMPESSGSELERALRQRRPSIPVVIVSGYPRDVPICESEHTSVVAKPVNLAKLGELVTAMLERGKQ